MLLKGKKGLITGVANDMSIAWGVARVAHQHGAELAFSYQGELLKKRIEPLAASVGSDVVVECDVTNDESLDAMFETINQKLGHLDFLLHAIAFSDKNELRGRTVDTTRKNFANTMNVSCFSLIAITQRAEKLMKNGGSIVALTYYGSEKVIKNYNIMGVAKAGLETTTKYLASDLGPQNIRVNCISPGPIKTLASSAIGDFKSMLDYNAENSPLRKNVTTQDVGNVAVYMFSDMSGGITGENVHVDSGYHILGAPATL